MFYQIQKLYKMILQSSRESTQVPAAQEIDSFQTYLFDKDTGVLTYPSRMYKPIGKHYVYSENNKEMESRKDFRRALRGLGAESLEKMLYGNNADEFYYDELPDDKTITEKFHALESQYRYLDTTPATLEQYKISLRMVYLLRHLEKRIDPNGGAMALDHSEVKTLFLEAYKMQVWFADFASVDNYLNQDTRHTCSPLLDALAHPISPNNDVGINLFGWRQLIERFGYDMLALMEFAPDIENSLGRLPHNIKEALHIACFFKYERAQENPRLAVLCTQYHLDEEVFNQYLELWAQRKSGTSVPSVFIPGNDVGYPGYHLVKLPLNDESFCILEHLINAKSATRQFVSLTDANRITDYRLPFTNLDCYVLLKCKTSQQNSPPFIEQAINYDAYDIVGYGEVKLTHYHNLAFRTWVNVNPDRDNAISKVFLRELGKRAVEEDSHIYRLVMNDDKMPEAAEDKESVSYYSERVEANTPDPYFVTVLFENIPFHHAIIQQIRNKIKEFATTLTDDELQALIPQRVFEAVIGVEKKRERFARVQLFLDMPGIQDFLSKASLQHIALLVGVILDPGMSLMTYEATNFFNTELQKYFIHLNELDKLAPPIITRLITSDFLAIKAIYNAYLNEVTSYSVWNALNINTVDQGNYCNAAVRLGSLGILNDKSLAIFNDIDERQFDWVRFGRIAAPLIHLKILDHDLLVKLAYAQHLFPIIDESFQLLQSVKNVSRTILFQRMLDLIFCHYATAKEFLKVLTCLAEKGLLNDTIFMGFSKTSEQHAQSVFELVHILKTKPSHFNNENLTAILRNKNYAKALVLELKTKTSLGYREFHENDQFKLEDLIAKLKTRNNSNLVVEKGDNFKSLVKKAMWKQSVTTATKSSHHHGVQQMAMQCTK